MGNIKIYSPNVQKKSTYIMIFISLSLTLIYVHVCKSFFNVISIFIPFVKVLDLIWLLWFNNILCISLHVGFISICYDDYKAFNIIYNKFLNNLVIKVFFL